MWLTDVATTANFGTGLLATMGNVALTRLLVCLCLDQMAARKCLASSRLLSRQAGVASTSWALHWRTDMGNITLLREDGKISPQVLLQLAQDWQAASLIVIALDADGRLMVGSSEDELDKIVAMTDRASNFLMRQYP